MIAVWRSGGLAVGTAVVLSTAGLPGQPSAVSPACDPDNGGITLPAGFCALVVADQVGPARHLAVAPNGDLFVAIEARGGRGGVLALRDTSADGKADVQERFGTDGGTGIALGRDVLYFSTSTTVFRFPIAAGRLTPTGAAQIIVRDLPAEGSHRAKSLALSPDRRTLFVNIGSPSNSCQVADRSAESPGKDPCPELATRAGVWRFDANEPNQTQDGKRFATGIRNAVGLGFDPGGGLWATQHGRDQLGQNWGRLFTLEQSAEKPSEELLHVREGDDFGWPYCYHDPELRHRVLAPEYGGDGKKVERCAQKMEPALAFPAHWAPNGLLFYTATQFPAAYRRGVFITFHGSWNRAPLPQQGFHVVFVPFKEGKPAGAYQTFADGFRPESGDGPQHRPVGVAQGPDGSLYITDDAAGRIWRVMYKGR
ncbi:MAG: PQQ-dependent sugar dehydrogenase [Gemmatimonadales bacterium]